MSATSKKSEVTTVSPEISRDVKEKIITARIGLLLRHPWFGNMATRLLMHEANDWCPTAATNGRDLFYNTEFINGLNLDEVEFVIAHEILHSALDHIYRREDRIPMVYNIACDYLVNNILVRDNIGSKPEKINIYQDFKYDGWTSEDIYDSLYNTAQEQLDAMGELLDEHVDWEDADGNGAQGQGKEDINGKPVLSREELESIKNDVKENIISAAQASGAGNIPGEITRLIRDLTEAKLDWKDILQQQIQSTLRNNYTFARPSRKGWGSNIIIPGMDRDETIDIAISLDTSGSITEDQIRDFLSEVKGIMDQYCDYKIDLWTFDTKVYNHVTYTSDDSDEIENYEICGGGGTDFAGVWDYMKENGISPKKLIMFSDMYAFGSFGDPDYCDTIFINHGRPDFEAPFGMTIPYDVS